MKRMGLYISLSLLIDQIIKIVVETFLNLNQDLVIIENFFSLTYVRNYGAAFSLLNGNRILFICIGIIALFVLYFFFLKDKKLTKFEKGVYSLLISGIIGNLIDRAVKGYVVDYLSFTIFTYSYPIFNFADICIVLSTVGILIMIGKEEYHARSNHKSKGK